MNCYKLFFLFKLGIVVGAFISDSHTMSETNAISHSDAKFPAAFKFGAATAAYQIEGAWNVDGKGPNIWDTLCHEHPDLIADHLNGDVGPDSYNLYKQDILALKEIGFNFYRFSISWSRILPTGDVSSLNQKGIDYYNKLIDDLIAANIEPVATMLHYDLPQPLQDLGGYANPVIVGYFESYANILYSHFGDRVKTWITFNEPFDFCVDGYGTGNIAPLIAASGVGEYLCGHNVLLSHAAAYHVYKEKYFAKFNGKIGITLNSRFFYPKNENVTDDVIERALQYRLGWLANPIFSATGGYPPIMIEEIAINSLREGRDWSRLPPMNDVIKDYIKGSADFIGFNYYTSRLVELDKSTETTASTPSWRKDSKILMTVDDKWTRAKSNWLYSVPKGLGDVLRWIKNEYNNPEVLITENGWSDDGQLNDNGRVLYLKEHLAEVLKATVHDNCNVTGYTVWSIIDNFEWLRGYTERFGLYSVDFNSTKKERKAKLSAKYMNTVITTRELPNGEGEINN